MVNINTVLLDWLLFGGSQLRLILACSSLMYGPKSGSAIASTPGAPLGFPGEGLPNEPEPAEYGELYLPDGMPAPPEDDAPEALCPAVLRPCVGVVADFGISGLGILNAAGGVGFGGIFGGWADVCVFAGD